MQTQMQYMPLFSSLPFLPGLYPIFSYRTLTVGGKCLHGWISKCGQTEEVGFRVGNRPEKSGMRRWPVSRLGKNTCDRMHHMNALGDTLRRRITIRRYL